MGRREVKLNLGCSTILLPGFLNVDLWEPPGATDATFLRVDLRHPWPWPDSSAALIRAHDIAEHLPDKRHTMNEAWRVLRPGGQLDLVVPTTDGRGAFQDPTHVSFWTPNDLFYFAAGVAERERFGEAYGIRARFRVIKQEHREYPHRVWKLTAHLEAVKP
jgi:SAM-dependent methyltransferase